MNTILRDSNLRFLFGITLGIILAYLIIVMAVALGVYFRWEFSYLFPLVYIGHFITGLLLVPFVGFLIILVQCCQCYMKKYIKALHS